MDSRLRTLERLANSGDVVAKHKLLREHLRLGLLRPVSPPIAKQKKEMAYREAKRWELRARLRGDKRLTPAQRKLRRQRKRKNRTTLS